MTEKKKHYRIITRTARALQRAKKNAKSAATKDDDFDDISALLAEARKRQAGPESGGQKMEVVEFKGGGGLLTSMRGGFKDFVGQGETAKKKKTSVVDVLLWIACAVSLAYFIYKRFIK